jgi:flagellar hook-associated protein 3 FlgL
MIFNNGLSGLQGRQSDLYSVQNQLSTGKRVLTPADDPIAASEALQVTQSRGVNKQFLDNQANAQSQLTYLESTLGSIGDELIRIGELAAEGANPTLDDSQRSMIAEELKGRTSSLIGLANTRDGEGRYIFAGYQSTTKPFQEITESIPPASYDRNTPYVNYNGDGGRPSLQVSMSLDMPIGENGIDIFMQVRDAQGNTAGKSIFDSVQNLVNNLDGSPLVPYDPVAQVNLRAEITASLNHIATARASVGARQNTLEGLTEASTDTVYLYDNRLSELQDLDYTEAISRFTNYQMQLEAAQLSFKQSSQLSLFNIL